MKITSRRGLLTAAALVAALPAAALAAGPAIAATPAGSSADAGATDTYLVLSPKGHGTAQAHAAATRTDVDVVADYDAIGVMVVRATSAEAAALERASGSRVASTAGLGAPLDEGTVTRLDTAAATTSSGDDTTEPLWAYQWDMRQIKADQAHRISDGSRDVVVAVQDSGIDASHPDLASQVDPSLSAGCLTGAPDTAAAAWSPTTSFHGTHVAGTIAAARNGVGIVGTAPGVRLASVKVVNDAGFIYPQAAVCAFMWSADHGIDITNNSYYIDPWEFNCRNDAEQRVVWQAVQRAIRYSAQKGVVNVASAGNSNHDLAHKFIDDGSPDDGSGPVETREINNACLDLPAEAPGVVTVSATGFDERKAAYSSYGLGVVEVTAPGGDYTVLQPSDAPNGTGLVLSDVPGGYGLAAGTSMASPHAAGVLALIKSTHPNARPGRLTAMLQQQADPLTCPDVFDPFGDGSFLAKCSGSTQNNGFFGHGLVDALDAVTR